VKFVGKFNRKEEIAMTYSQPSVRDVGSAEEIILGVPGDANEGVLPKEDHS
jgi:hypothetical protein